MESFENFVEVQEFYKDTTFVINDVEEGKRILLTEDEYVRGLSEFEKCAKLKLAQPISTQELMQHQANQVISFDSSQIEKLKTLINEISKNVQRFSNLVMPPRIILCLTTGKEEGNAAYCRGKHGIFLPRGMVEQSLGEHKKIKSLICHELWHIISRNLDKSFRDQVYNIIHFKPMGSIMNYPASLLTRKLSNPDAPLLEHYLCLTRPATLQHQTYSNNENTATTTTTTTTMCVLPIIYSKSDTYEANCGKTFFDYLQLRVIEIQQSFDDPTKWEPVMETQFNSPSPLLQDETNPQQEDNKDFGPAVPRGFAIPDLPYEWWQKIGQNTTYVYHPEETIADNWKLLVMDSLTKYPEDVRTPGILLELGELLGFSQQ